MTDLPLEAQIWTAEDCAAYLGGQGRKMDRGHFLRVTRYQKDFPKPLKNFNERRPRWSAKAVVEWALQT